MKEHSNTSENNQSNSSRVLSEAEMQTTGNSSNTDSFKSTADAGFPQQYHMLSALSPEQ